jgi:hypothetical protein
MTQKQDPNTLWGSTTVMIPIPPLLQQPYSYALLIPPPPRTPCKICRSRGKARMPGHAQRRPRGHGILLPTCPTGLEEGDEQWDGTSTTDGRCCGPIKLRRSIAGCGCPPRRQAWRRGHHCHTRWRAQIRGVTVVPGATPLWGCRRVGLQPAGLAQSEANTKRVRRRRWI